MNQIQIHSVAKVFDRPGVLERVMTLVTKVAAMGLLPKSRRIEALDEDSFRVVLNSLQSGNLIGGRGPALSRIITAPATGASTKEQIAELDRLLTTIEESPVPAKEWAAMREIFRLLTVHVLESLGVVRSETRFRGLARSRRWHSAVPRTSAGSPPDILAFRERS